MHSNQSFNFVLVPFVSSTHIVDMHKTIQQFLRSATVHIMLMLTMKIFKQSMETGPPGRMQAAAPVSAMPRQGNWPESATTQLLVSEATPAMEMPPWRQLTDVPLWE